MKNTKKYWERRFETEDWEKKGGKEQTLFFAKLITDYIPAWFSEEARESAYSICDWGCAEGDATHFFYEFFKPCSLTGIDISEAAVQKAKSSYPECEFCACNIEDIGNYDIIISSNTLEHFFRPWNVAERLSLHAKRYLVFLVPFEEEPKISEHFYTFTYGNIPLNINDFYLRYFREIDTSKIKESFWDGKQILLIYEKNFNYSGRALSDIGAHHTSLEADRLKTELVETDLRLKNIVHEMNNIRLKFEAQLAEKDYKIQELNNSLRELSTTKQREIENLKQTISRITEEKETLFNTLNDIYNSGFWKIANRYHKIKQFFLKNFRRR